MSANERTETVFECIRGGAEDYLLKPVTRKEVQHMWQHVWRRQQQSALRVPHMLPEEVNHFFAQAQWAFALCCLVLSLLHLSLLSQCCTGVTTSGSVQLSSYMPAPARLF
jgi:DNA-binding response OmpR family regulator